MVKQFIQNFREAFGQKATLPLLFGYSNQPVADTERINGCFFKGLQAARENTRKHRKWLLTTWKTWA